MTLPFPPPPPEIGSLRRWLIFSSILLVAILLVLVAVFVVPKIQQLSTPTIQISKTGKAIQIQSMTSNDIFVQNVGSSDVTINNPCVYVDGVNVLVSSGTGTLATASTADLKLNTPISSGSHTVKVTSTDGVYSQVPKTFP